MIIDLTYACKMGCSHCISDCKPEGENMSLQQLSFSYKNVSLLKYPLLTRSKHRRVLLGNQPSRDTGWGLKQRESRRQRCFRFLFYKKYFLIFVILRLQQYFKNRRKNNENID